MHDAAKLVVAHGGSLSGEHGDGQSRGELLPIMFGDELVDAFRQFKRIWDPDGADEPRQDDRRLSHRREPAARARTTVRGPLKTHFAYPDDGTASPA